MEQSANFYIYILTNMRDNIAKRKKPIEEIMDDHISAFGEDVRGVCAIQEEALNWAIELIERTITDKDRP